LGESFQITLEVNLIAVKLGRGRSHLLLFIAVAVYLIVLIRQFLGIAMLIFD
jgi:hypothetical protein